MAVINYNKDLVGFTLKEAWYSDCVDTATPTIKFFIHVWQKAACLQDVVDTLQEAHLTSAVDGRYKLIADKYNVRARATRWRKKGIPLKSLRATPTYESLKQFALREVI
jgi:hypothetical protein